MIRDALLIVRKDLRIELSTRVTLAQILPFGLLNLLLYGFALSPDLKVVGEQRSVLQQVAPGLFWLAVLFASVLALGRSFAIEASDGKLDALRMAGVDPAGVFVGKATAVAVQIFALEIVLGFAAWVMFGPPVGNVVLLVTTIGVATVAIAAAGTLYAAVTAGSRVRDTLAPLLILPVLTPVLLGATLATDAAFFGPSSDGTPWLLLVLVFALLFIGVGMMAFGSLLEES